MAKNKNKASEIIESFEEKVQEIVFDFSDKDFVVLIGTGAKGFAMSPKKEYEVIGKVAKILIKKGAAKLK
jgi:predicted GH43/DUF377 family glycosyl hydrolase